MLGVIDGTGFESAGSSEKAGSTRFCFDEPWLGGFFAKVANKIRTEARAVLEYGEGPVRILDDEIREKDPSDYKFNGSIMLVWMLCIIDITLFPYEIFGGRLVDEQLEPE